MPKNTQANKIGQLLVLLGGIIGLLFGIMDVLLIANPLHAYFPTLEFGIGAVIVGAILIILSLAVLATSGAVKIKFLTFDNNWIVLLILGILMYIFAGGIGAILVILGAILMLL
ncbi:MAG: hypothetical protein C4K47_06010 [Candidatus Thorarchaeota archaeon]|nr:MAG: hypothetical protein C4K47_06010 [Candidatus Thorarchaeota archaeon]